MVGTNGETYQREAEKIMPFYEYKCNECSHEFEEFKTIAKYNEPLREPCPSCFHVGYISRLISSPKLGDPTKLEMTKGLIKPTKEFNDILRTIKKKNPGSTIEVRD